VVNRPIAESYGGKMAVLFDYLNEMNFSAGNFA